MKTSKKHLAKKVRRAVRTRIREKVAKVRTQAQTQAQSLGQINITTIKNTIDRDVIITNDLGKEFRLKPNEMMMNYTQLSVPIIAGESEFNEESFRIFQVEGDSRMYGYIAVDGDGIISALGTLQSDFFPDDPNRVKKTHEVVTDGDPIILTFMEDESVPGEGRIIWVLGDHDDADES